MATQAGVWIDHKQAIVVLLTDVGEQVKKIAFNIGQPARTTSRSRAKNKYTRNDFIAEDKLERKVEIDRKDYYDDVVAAIRGSRALLILGPGEAKGELSKHMQAKKIRSVAVELQTADKLTDRQLAAKIKQHFAPGPAKKSVASKTKKKIATKPAAGKRAKRAKK